MKPEKRKNRCGLVSLLVVLLVLFFACLFLLNASYVGHAIESVPSSVTVVVEEPVIPEQPPVSSGGGGGVALSPKEKFMIDKDLIKVLVKQGESERTTLEIMNLGEAGLDIQIDEDDVLRKLIIVSEKEFFIEPGEVKIINIDFFARENEIPDAYTGRLIVKSGKLEGIVNVIIEVKEKNPLFDIRVRVDERNLFRGDKVNANISIVNMGDLMNMDIILYYSIKNFKNDIFFFREESLAIGKMLNVPRNFDIPIDAPFDDYVFYVKVSYENISAASVDSFKIKDFPSETPMLERWMQSDYFVWIILLLLILILLAIIIIGYLLYRKISFWGFVRKKTEEKIEAQRSLQKV